MTAIRVGFMPINLVTHIHKPRRSLPNHRDLTLGNDAPTPLSPRFSSAPRRCHSVRAPVRELVRLHVALPFKDQRIAQHCRRKPHMLAQPLRPRRPKQLSHPLLHVALQTLHPDLVHGEVCAAGGGRQGPEPRGVRNIARQHQGADSFQLRRALPQALEQVDPAFRADDEGLHVRAPERGDAFRKQAAHVRVSLLDVPQVPDDAKDF
mmetsp:Transcript_54810/g.111872  ORF Transcript_54810/g.111872 Transcript_54810/m.111872 type:complete len:207 (-) Transcript_54810:1441-2061(-)